MSTCDHCGADTPERELTDVQTARPTHSSPAEYEAWCRRCVGVDDRDAAYERAAARARNNDFAETGGRDWT